MAQICDESGKRLGRCLDCQRERYHKTEISRHIEASHIQQQAFNVSFVLLRARQGTL